MDTCDLIDLGYIGTDGTFEKRVVGGSHTRVRLDQELATPDWNAAYPFWMLFDTLILLV